MRAEKIRLNILGASGHGKVVADIAKLNGYTEIYFYDDNTELTECGRYPIVGTEEDLRNALGQIFIAIGNPKTRKRVMEENNTRNFPVLIHPKAVIAEGVEIGEGSVVMAGAVVNSGSVIGKGCILNTCCSVDHDCVVEDYVHIAVGAHFCGAVKVEDETWIGAGATVNNNVNICGGCFIGAGAVVIKDIDEPGIYVGVPAKIKA